MSTNAPNSRDSDLVISVATVVRDHAAMLGGFVEDVLRVLSANYQYFELLIVDNGSPPEVSAELQQLLQRFPHLRLLRLSRYFPSETALAAALENCIGDYVVIMEADHDPAEVIPKLVEQAVKGVDVVIAEPEEDAGRPMRGRLATGVFQVASRVLGQPVQADVFYFRLLSRRVVNTITKFRNRSRYLGYLSSIVGFSQSHISYRRVFRQGAAPQRLRLRRAVMRAIDLVISESAVPLRFVAGLGILASLLNLLYLVYILIVTIVKRRLAEGWLTISVTHTVMFLILFLILAVLAEYVARILDETKDRPLYFVEYELKSSVTAKSAGAEVKERLNVV